MTPMIVHRYSVPLTEVISALIKVGDCEKIDAVIVGENLVIDVLAPAQAAPEREQIEEPPSIETPAPPARKGGALAQKAGILCNEKGFQAFIEVKTPDAAKAFIYQRCGVDSRVDLDHEPEAAAKFRDLTSEYDVWLSCPD